MRALGDARRGWQGRTVTVGYVVPAPTAADCCCPSDHAWYSFNSPPTTCEVYEGATETDRYFRGSTMVDADCLAERGFLTQKSVLRRTVSCADVACPGQPAPPDDGTVALTPSPEPVTVFVPTPALDGLAKPGGKPTSVDYIVGTDHMGELFAYERTGLNSAQVTFKLKEETTPLVACVLENRSRAPGPNRKVDLEFVREGGAWR